MLLSGLSTLIILKKRNVSTLIFVYSNMPVIKQKKSRMFHALLKYDLGCSTKPMAIIFTTNSKEKMRSTIREEISSNFEPLGKDGSILNSLLWIAIVMALRATARSMNILKAVQLTSQTAPFLIGDSKPKQYKLVWQ